MLKQKPSLSRSTYFVRGMHCAACEILIEKKIIKLDSVEMVDVSLSRGTVTVEYHPTRPVTPESLNQIFQDDGYSFSSKPFKKNHRSTSDSSCVVPQSPQSSVTPFLITAVLILGYIVMAQTGLSTLVSVNSQSSLPVFFLFGLLAGVSSCAALVGGIVLSLSKQWLSSYGNSDSFFKKSEPHFMFNLGRILGYTAFGGVLGVVGNFFQLSPVFSASTVIVVSVVMVLLGLQMLGVKSLSGFQIRLPKSLTGRLADESNFQGRFAPLLMGALTFFLPCGFTITTQALALASGSLTQGALIMGLFALGTAPGLLAIGLSSVKFYSNQKFSSQFSLVAGMLVLFFAVFNINSQLAVLGAPNLDTVFATTASSNTSKSVDEANLPPVVDGKQVVKMNVSSSGYSPNKIKIRVGIPVVWQITTTSNPGCADTIVSQGLFPERLNLVPGGVFTKEFTAQKTGSYRFSCSMGMYTGTFEVVDGSGQIGNDPSAQVIDSGSHGCGCGGGSADGSTSCH